MSKPTSRGSNALGREGGTLAVVRSFVDRFGISVLPPAGDSSYLIRGTSVYGIDAAAISRPIPLPQPVATALFSNLVHTASRVLVSLTDRAFAIQGTTVAWQDRGVPTLNSHLDKQGSVVVWGGAA